MAKEKKMVEAITSMDEDFAQWYTDIVKKAELSDYSSVKGCMIIKPAGYAIWENIRNELDKRFKATGVENVYLPMFIPESLLEKEKDHVEGFAPEVAWVTHGGLDPLQERLCVRPTSETLFCDFYAKEIQSHRDLPKVYNQWCSVVRWEKTTRPFLRSREFLWQEGHTAHATAEEAEERTIQMLNLYADFCEEVLAIPVIKGQKTDKEKFSGAEATYTIESLMHDGKALQSGTSHNFGDGFARAFGIQYTDKENKLQYVHQTSWGMTTRMIGAIIMVHGDDNGLVLPPRIAPVQIMVVPIQQKKEGVLDKALDEQLANVATRAQMAHVLANLLPETVLPPVNDSLITQAYASRRRITDVTEYTPYYNDILKLYRCGISVGSDETGSFLPDSPITRGAAAAMLTRMVDPSLRLTPDWHLPELYSAEGAAYEDLVTAGTYIAAPETAADYDQAVRYMLSQGENTLSLKYDQDFTVSSAQEALNNALLAVKRHCEQGYNNASCSYNAAGTMILKFSSTAGERTEEYRKRCLPPLPSMTRCGSRGPLPPPPPSGRSPGPITSGSPPTAPTMTPGTTPPSATCPTACFITARPSATGIPALTICF